MVPLLRHGGTNCEFLSSDLLRLCPTNFADATTRNLVTTASYDLNRPVPVPYVWDRTDRNTSYQLNTAIYPPLLSQQSITSPFAPATIAALRSNVPARSEFQQTDWRSTLTALGKINLNRPLRSFPNPDATTGLIPAAQRSAFTDALSDRQILAQDIFNVLQQVTGARDLAKDAALTQANYPVGQWNALRYLAQLAANIVDFIDADDNMTPFQWSAGNDWVFGVEMPRLVINEVYVQYDNDPTDPGLALKNSTQRKATTHYNVNVWVELLNPLDSRTDPATTMGLTSDTSARLAHVTSSNTNEAIYQVVIADPATKPVLQRPDNVTGDPNFDGVNHILPVGGASQVGLATARVASVDAHYTRPAQPATKGFCVLGPQTAFLPGEDPKLPAPGQAPDFASPQMTYVVPVTAANASTVPQPAILLRRLACPGMPAQTNPTRPGYNPYVTIDSVVKSTSGTPHGNDARHYVSTGANVNYQPLTSRQSMGRKQPYDASSSVAQEPTPKLTGQPQHTFNHCNGQSATAPLPPGDSTLQVPFDFFVFLDRQLISKAELLYTPGCRPHELTQFFVQQGVANSQAAPWLDPTTRLSRFLEFGDVAPRGCGIPLGGRVPGRININMVFAPQIFNAIAGAEPGNRYNQAQVASVFTSLVNARQPNSYYVGTGAVPTPDGTDTPFWGFGPGPAPGGDALSAAVRGLNAQWFSPYPATTNPYQRFEMLNKIMNNLTTRSNVFAVWLTVGFFEVTDDTTTPPKLGPEVGAAQGRKVRHRLFAIVDRTNVQIFATAYQPANGQPIVGSVSGVSYPIQLARMSGTVAQSGFAWKVQPGSVLVFDPNDPAGNEETVVVQPGNVATFFKSHAAGCIVISRGNPGPATRLAYDPRKDSAVVPYFAVIE